VTAPAHATFLATRARMRLRPRSAGLPPYREVFGPLVAGRSFADVGAMWSVHGRYSFEAEDAGATQVTAVDAMAPTPEFEAEHARRGSSTRFVRGDVNDPALAAAVGPHDVVWSSGVLYHVPSPALTIERLAAMATGTLIVQSRTVPGRGSSAVFFPGMSERQRRPYARLFPGAVGVDSPFDRDAGYGNWFWGLTPGALTALVALLPHFEIERTITCPLDTLVVASRR
jgi:2-polyprenyl-3-methyl-5-hydroxy-6-metoxy-1,4-benzoquinol methylase